MKKAENPTVKDKQTTVYCGIKNGTVIRKHIRAKNTRELNKKVAEIRMAINENKKISEKTEFGIWADKWINEYKIPSGISNGTIIQYKSAIKHLNNYFEYESVKNINLATFQKVINDLAMNNPNTGRPMSKASLYNIKKVCKNIFDYMTANNVYGVPNFFSSVIIPKKAPKMHRRALTELEQDMIINTPHRCQTGAMIMMFSGVRRGELIPLRWEDVDLKNEMIFVNKSVEFIDNKPFVKSGGKTSGATRIIPIPPILVEYLKLEKKSSQNDAELICSGASGQMHTVSSFRKMWDSYILELNIKYGYPDMNISKFNPTKIPLKIEKFTPHYLRHTYATLLYLQGIDIVTAKQYMGHADIQTTVNIYTDLNTFNINNISPNYKKKIDTIYKIRKI